MARYVDADELFTWIAIELYLEELDPHAAYKIGRKIEDSIEKYNRVELIEDTTIVQDPYGRPGFTCSVCGGYFEGDSAPNFIYCPLCGRLIEEKTDDGSNGISKDS